MVSVIKFQNDSDELLPLISLADLHSGNATQAKKVADALGRAARDVGFFRVCDHGIDMRLIEATYDASRRFFLQSEAEKQRYYIGNSRNHRGYVPFTEKGDYPDEINRSYESFDLGLDLPDDDPDYLAGNRVLGPNVWPQVDGFQDTVAAYYDKISNLGRLVCSALEMHLDLPQGFMTDQMSKPISQLRLLHYVRKAATLNHKSVNMGAHTDYECLTLLHTHNEGLQVMMRDDNWIDVPIDPAAFVVNIGDMMEAWTNGQFRSTPHRVLNLSPERFSLPYFVAANYDTVIEPFSQLIDRGQKPRYDTFLAGEHLEQMLMRDFPYLRHAKQREKPEKSKVSNSSMRNPFEQRLNGARI